MFVCLCNSITDAEIRQHAADGVADFETLRDTTGCSGSCGCCEDTAREVFARAQETPPAFAMRVVNRAA